MVDYDRFVQVCEAQGLPKPAKRMFTHIRNLYRDGQANYLSINSFDQLRRDRRQDWNGQRVQDLINDGSRESERLDFKESLAGDGTTKKPWAAMANSGGGAVIYGIAEVSSKADHLAPIPFDGVEERIEQLNQSIDPPVALSVKLIPIEGDDQGIVAVEVKPSVPGTVHFVDHRAPVRSKTTTRYMSAEEIRRWIREQQRPPAPEA